MLFIEILGILSLTISSVLGKSSMQVSAKFDSKRLQTIQKKSQNGIIDFYSELFKEMVFDRNGKRDFNLFLLFNALDEQTNCKYCRPTHDAFLESSQIFETNARPGLAETFFGTIELMTNIEVFKIMNLEHVPVVMHFGPNKKEPTLFTKGVPNDRNALIMFFLEQSQSQIKATEIKQSDMEKIYGAFALSVVFFILSLGFFGFFKLDSILKNNILWSVLITSFLVLMLSGHMWTRIRGAPFFAIKNTGKFYIAPSPQSQLGAETRMVFFLNLFATFSFIMVPIIISSISDPNTRRIGAMIGSLLFMACHSGLHRLFAFKFPGYALEYIL